MHRTLVIRREYLHFIPKYSRYEKRHKNLAAHVSPAFRVEEGDQVTVGQCRPLSKTVRWIRCRIWTLSIYCYGDTNRSGYPGSVQCTARPTSHRQGSEGILEVLADREQDI